MILQLTKMHSPVEMTLDELIQLFFGEGMPILKFVESGKFDDIKTVWGDDVRLALQQVFAF